jgi:hypothetical protein
VLPERAVLFGLLLWACAPSVSRLITPKLTAAAHTPTQGTVGDFVSGPSRRTAKIYTYRIEFQDLMDFRI